MKSSYELAMERLNRQSPKTAPLTPAQKKKIAEIDSLYRSKIAEKEVFLKPKIEQARFSSDEAAVESLETQLRDETKSLRDHMETEKEKIRNGEAAD